MNRSTQILVLIILTAIIVALSDTPTVIGVADDPVLPLEPDKQFFPYLTSRHDPTLDPPVFGVQMYGDTSPASSYYPFLMGSGSTWLRVSISWSSVEPIKTEPPSYYWAFADLALSAGRLDMGALSLVATIVSNPDWAAPYPNGPISPDELGSFAAFVRAAVERYDGDGIDDAPGSPTVKHWEFYNEPDALVGSGSAPHWGGEGDQYAQMLSAIYTPVKEANPSAQVLIGGLAYDWFEDGDPPGPFDRHFLDDVLTAGGGDFFDLMNFHVYPVFWYNWVDYESPGLLEKANYLKELLADHGYPNKGIVVTESGWHSNSSSTPPGDPEEQARYVAELFTQSMAAGSNFMIWWMLYDVGGTYPYDNGLVTNGSSPQTKAAYQAFQVAVSKLGLTHFQRIFPVADPGPPVMEAYEFKDNVHQQAVYVAWLDPVNTQGSRPLRIPGAWATVSDIYGSSRFVWDDLDGQQDGFVTVEVGGQPVYIEVPW